MSDIDLVSQLEGSGIPRRQAEAQVKVMSSYIDDKFATKQEMTNEFKSVRADMAAEFKSVRSEMAAEFKLVRAEMRELNKDTLLEISKIMAHQLGVVVATIGVFMAILGVVLSLILS